MYNRQAHHFKVGLFLAALMLLSGLLACSPSNRSGATPIAIPSTATETPVPPTATITPSPTATPLTCLSQDGELDQGDVPTNGAPTAFIIYLPPCYNQFTDQRYPVLYLLNGFKFDKDPYPAGEQWIRIGAPVAADRLILSRQAAPFIIIFPEDRYVGVEQGVYFGQYVINNIIPYIDSNYRTLADREHRAIGGLSRGGGWAFQLGMTRTDLFGAVGLHSPAIFPDDRAIYEYWLHDMPAENWPRVYLDVGDNDPEKGFDMLVEGVFTKYELPHEWHLNTGAHDAAYWSAHVNEYIEWYAEGWQDQPPLP